MGSPTSFAPIANVSAYAKFVGNEKSGVDTSDDRFAVWTHNIYEDITEIISQLIYDNEEGIRYFFVIDSMDALITKDDFDKKMDESKTVAGGARLSSVFLKKVCVRIAFRGHHLMALSQTRMNMNSRAVGQVSMKPSGGKAIEFFTSLTGYIKNIGRSGSSFSKHIHESRNDLKSKPIGHYFTIEFVKTYHERSYEEIGIPIKYGHGVWHEQECLDLCMAYQYITKSGAWYEFSEDIIKLVEDKGEEMVAKHQGEQKVIDFLENNPKITWIILDFIKDLCISSNKALSKLIIEDDSDVSSSKAD